MQTDRLTSLLEKAPIGLIQGDIRKEILEQVADCWLEFSGSTDTKMESRKINRDEGPTNLTWEPPILSFTIMRHGAAVLGSTRAEKQRWKLDLARKTATPEKIGFQQLRPRAPVLDVKAIANTVCAVVVEGQKSVSDLITQGAVSWKSDDEIIIKQGMLVPDDGPQQTIAGRRKRFRIDLRCKMDALGWRLIKVGRSLIFQKKKQAPCDS